MTTTGHDHDKHAHGRAITAIFDTRDDARSAIAELHKKHFTHTWFGVTSVAETDDGDETVTIDKPGFFSSTAQNIVDALEEHGVPPETAHALEPVIEPGQAILTVDPRDKDAAEAMTILESAGGEIAESAISRTNDGGSTVRSRFDGGPAMNAAELPETYYEEIFYFRTGP
jgi:hypothetical protein